MSRPALSATRAISILNFLAAHPAEEFTLSDLAACLDVNVASLHALLGVLADAGYVTRHARLRTYTLGPSVVALGSAALERHNAIDLARDAARDLSDELDLEVAVTALAGADIVFLSRAGEPRARGIAVHVGQRVPLIPPLGSVFIAWASDERVSGWIERSSNVRKARGVLAGVRSRGYSVALDDDARRGLGDALDRLADKPADTTLRGNVDELVIQLGHSEYQVAKLDRGRKYDVAMLAAPVFDAVGETVLALTLLGFQPGLTPDRIAACGKRLRDAGLVVTKRSKGRIPSNA